MDYYSFTDPEGMEDLVGWPIANTLSTKWSHVYNISGKDQGKSASKRPNHWATPSNDVNERYKRLQNRHRKFTITQWHPFCWTITLLFFFFSRDKKSTKKRRILNRRRRLTTLFESIRIETNRITDYSDHHRGQTVHYVPVRHACST